MLVDPELRKLDRVSPVFITFLIHEVSDAKSGLVLTPLDFAGDVLSNELLVNDWLDGLLGDAEALDTRLLYEHANDAVLVESES